MYKIIFENIITNLTKPEIFLKREPKTMTRSKHRNYVFRGSGYQNKTRIL